MLTLICLHKRLETNNCLFSFNINCIANTWVADTMQYAPGYPLLTVSISLWNHYNNLKPLSLVKTELFSWFSLHLYTYLSVCSYSCISFIPMPFYQLNNSYIVNSRFTFATPIIFLFIYLCICLLPNYTVFTWDLRLSRRKWLKMVSQNAVWYLSYLSICKSFHLIA